jgi:hypothetical protein
VLLADERNPDTIIAMVEWFEDDGPYYPCAINAHTANVERGGRWMRLMRLRGRSVLRVCIRDGPAMIGRCFITGGGSWRARGLRCAV